MKKSSRSRTRRQSQNSFRFEQLEPRTVCAGLAEMVEDSVLGGGINSGNVGSDPANSIQIGDTVYFTANDGTNGIELWKITSTGVPQLVEDAIPGGGINATTDSRPASLTNVNGTLYFTANDGVNGRELWRIGTSGVAEMVQSFLPGGINPNSGGSYPDRLTNVNGTLFFTADDGQNGNELFRVSSGAASMIQSKFWPGGIARDRFSSVPSDLTDVNGTLYFTAFDGTRRTLWSFTASSGANAVQIKDQPNVFLGGNNDLRFLINVSGTLYFQSSAGDSTGLELWRINAEGKAELVEDNIPGGGVNATADSFPSALTNVGGQLYFTANDGTGFELWRVNSQQRAEMVEDDVPLNGINNAGGATITSVTNVNGTVYFSADFGGGGELWRVRKSDGIAELVEDSIPGNGINVTSGSSPNNLANIGNTLYFSAVDASTGRELWRVDADGIARLVSDVNPNGDSNPTSLSVVNDTLYFTANDGLPTLWRVVGQGSPQRVQSTVEGGKVFTTGSPTTHLRTNLNGSLVFNATDGLNGTEIWRIGSSGLAEQFNLNQRVGGSGIFRILGVSGTTYFVANDGLNGIELWRSDKEGLATLVEDSIAGGGIHPTGDSSPAELANVGGRLFFSANDGSNGVELWRINSQGKAEMVEDSIPGDGIRAGGVGSNPTLLTNVGGTAYFVANDGTNGDQLWRAKSEGLASIVEDVYTVGGGINAATAPTSLVNISGRLYFVASSTQGSELWRINDAGLAEMVEKGSSANGGIAPGNKDSSVSLITNVNGVVYFRASDGTNGVELWRINASGFAEMVEVNPGAGSSTPNNLLNLNGTLYFTASDGSSGVELFRVNAAGKAELVEDSVPGGGIHPTGSSNPSSLTAVNNTLFFSATDGTTGLELWRVNSSGLAELVQGSGGSGGINPSSSSAPAFLAVVGNKLYFSATDGTNGTELWRVGATGPAEMLSPRGATKGINTNSNSFPFSLTNVNGVLFFVADDGVNGAELWQVNPGGLPELVGVSDAYVGINPTGPSSPSALTSSDGVLYFVANDGVNGDELWRVRTSAVTVDVNKPEDRVLPESSPSLTVDLTKVFVSSNGSPLAYEVTSTRPGLVQVNTQGDNLSLNFTPRRNGSATIQVTATSVTGATYTTSFAITITNSTPTLTVSGPIDGFGGVVGQTRTLRFSALDNTDNGTSLYLYEIDWGDATSSKASSPATVDLGHVYTTTGTKTVRARVTDPDGAVSDWQSVSFAISESESQGNQIVISGTSGDDQVVVTPTGLGSLSLVLNSNPAVILQEGMDKFLFLGDLGNDSVVVNGSSQNDTINITSTSVSWRPANSLVTKGIDFAGIETLQIQALGGNDDITLNASQSGTPSLSLDGGSGLDKLSSAGNVAGTWTISGTNQGTVGTGPVTATFTAVENLQGSDSAVDNFTLTATGLLSGSIQGGNSSGDSLNAAASSNTVTVNLALNTATNVQSGWTGIESFTGNGGSLLGRNADATWLVTGSNNGSITYGADSVSFTNFKSLSGGSLDDVFDLSASGSQVQGTLAGGTGTDTLKLPDNASVSLATSTATGVGRFSAMERFIASGTTSSLSASDTDNNWSITGANKGTLTATAGTTSFDGFARLVGGRLIDNFVFQAAGSITGSINGFSGVNKLDFGARTAAVTVNSSGVGPSAVTSGASIVLPTFSQVSVLVGSSVSGDTLLGPTSTTAWVINSVNSGTVGASSFAGFENLQGGASVDTFTLQGSGTVASINGGNAVDTLIAANGNNLWSITGIAAGTLNTNLSFALVENLTGGTADDRFDMQTNGRVSGTLDDLGGFDVLSYASRTTGVNVNMSTSPSTATSIATARDVFELIEGGSGADVIVGSNAHGTVILGNGGADQLTGGALRDVIIGGLGADVIRGGAGDDLVIGDRLQMADLYGSLKSLWDIWRDTAKTYGQRVTELSSSTASYKLVPGLTVQDDNAIDQVFGEGGLDWFFVGENDEAGDDDQPNETVYPSGQAPV